jgi:predicted ester cyclase
MNHNNETGGTTVASCSPEPAVIAERVARFDYSEQVLFAGGAKAERNWNMLLAHTSAEWSGDLEGTMATMSRNDPFQIMHATSLDVRGFEQVREFYRERLTTFQGQGFFPHRWVVSDQIIVGTGYFSATPSGVFFGIASHGKTLCVPMTVWIYFEDGLIKGEAAYLDGDELRRQIVHGTTRRRTDPIL